MKYNNFREKLKKNPYFASSALGGLTSSPQTLQLQLGGWVKNGKVIRLRRGLYTLSENDRKTGLSNLLLANVLYSPSYISLEYALGYYGLIPERVHTVTSVTTRKTNVFSNAFGNFSYRSVKKNIFTGYVFEKDEFGFDYLIATPEKALLDYLYFAVKANVKLNRNYFEESLRLQSSDELDTQKLFSLAGEMKSRKMLRMVDILIQYLEANKT